MLVTRLGRLLGLPMPRAEVIEASDWLIEHAEELRIDLGVKKRPCRSGQQFGSLYVGDPLRRTICPRNCCHNSKMLRISHAFWFWISGPRTPTDARGSFGARLHRADATTSHSSTRAIASTLGSGVFPILPCAELAKKKPSSPVRATTTLYSSRSEPSCKGRATLASSSTTRIRKASAPQ